MGADTLNTFWTGRLSPYQHLCLASWIAHGFNAVVYTTEADIEVPKGVEKRPAAEILDLSGKIYRYKAGPGEGSPSLHANLFRYKLLLRGGWWLDADVVVLRDKLPGQDIFIARQADNVIGNAVMRFPAGSPLIHEAVSEALRIADDAKWTETGPLLIDRLIDKHWLNAAVSDQSTAYAINYTEVIKFFDPAAREEVDARVASSTFVHLWNQVWTIIGFPQEFGPPEGSYIDTLFGQYAGRNVFQARIPITSIRTWWQNREHVLSLLAELRQARARISASPTYRH